MRLANMEPNGEVNKAPRWVGRFVGRAYGAYPDFRKYPTLYGGKLDSHIESLWTTPEHWAHNNYGRGHLPQLCVRASGWKARLIACILWPEPPFDPNNTTTYLVAPAKPWWVRLYRQSRPLQSVETKCDGVVREVKLSR